MNLLNIKQVVDKYPNIFKSEKLIKSYITRNKYNIRSVAIRISHQILFEEEKFLEWVKSMTYESAFKYTRKNDKKSCDEA